MPAVGCGARVESADGARVRAVPGAPSPSDFWGEHSADMHHVVQHRSRG